MRLDIGCGKTKMDGWEGIDSIDFGQKHVHDIRNGIPFPDASIDEVRSSHFVEHLTWDERINFFNELYRVLKPKATATIITPDWKHDCFYGDPTHKAPLSQWYPLYLNKLWRDANAPHVPYTCDFDYTTAGSWDQAIELRSPEVKGFMMHNYVNCWRDLIIALTKK